MLDKPTGDHQRLANKKTSLLDKFLKVIEPIEREPLCYKRKYLEEKEIALSGLDNVAQVLEKDRINFNILKEANMIIRDRTKHNGVSNLTRNKSKYSYLEDNRDICLKNYLIGLLKEERTQTNEKEIGIKEALETTDKKLDMDKKAFINYIDKEKKQLKETEEVTL